MIIAGFILAALAAALHVYIFVLEAFLWTAPAGRKTFGTTAEEAEATRSLAFNQGFYNLFLAVVTVVGLFMHSSDIGIALILAGTGSMAAAALVLFFSAPDKRGAAVKQGTLPLLAVVLLATSTSAT